MTGTILRLSRKHGLFAISSTAIAASCIGFVAWQQSARAGAVTPASEPEVRLVKVTAVEPQNLPDERRAIGEIRPRRESDLGFRVSGKVVMRAVDVGSTVTKGDVIARVDDQDYRNRLLSAKADQAAAEAVLVEAAASERRINVLLEKGYTTRANHDAAMKNLRSAQAKLDSANIALNMATDQLAYTELRADFAGVVTAVASEEGQIVNAGQTVVRLADPNIKDAVFSIAESSFARGGTTGGLPAVKVALLSNPEVTALGRVREIGPMADSATGTYQVKVSIDGAPEAMRFGASVSGRIESGSAEMVVLPGSALFDKDGAAAVWVVNAASRVELQPVGIARFEADRIIVSGGLARGDIVVTAGVNRLRESQSVRIIEGDRK